MSLTISNYKHKIKLGLNLVGLFINELIIEKQKVGECKLNCFQVPGNVYLRDRRTIV